MTTTPTCEDNSRRSSNARKLKACSPKPFGMYIVAITIWVTTLILGANADSPLSHCPWRDAYDEHKATLAPLDARRPFPWTHGYRATADCDAARTTPASHLPLCVDGTAPHYFREDGADPPRPFGLSDDSVYTLTHAAAATRLSGRSAREEDRWGGPGARASGKRGRRGWGSADRARGGIVRRCGERRRGADMDYQPCPRPRRPKRGAFALPLAATLHQPSAADNRGLARTWNPANHTPTWRQLPPCDIHTASGPPSDRGYGNLSSSPRLVDGDVSDAMAFLTDLSCILLIAMLGPCLAATAAVCTTRCAVDLVAAFCLRAHRRVLGRAGQRIAWQAHRVGLRRAKGRRTVDLDTQYILVRGRTDGKIRLTNGRGPHVRRVRRGGDVVFAVRSRGSSGTAVRTALCGAVALSMLTHPCLTALTSQGRGGLTPAQACAGSHGQLRVGEAGGPGPGHMPAGGAASGTDNKVQWRGGRNHSPLAYPTPGKMGFHGCHTAGFARSLPPPPNEPFELKVVTANTSGWLPLRTFLLATDAHVVFGQEHRLAPDDIADASAWARRNGWKSVWAPAVQGPSGGSSAGTVVLARDCCGLRHPDVGDAVVVEGRAVGAMVEPPGCRPFMGYCAYFKDGQGLSRENLDIAAKVGDHVQAQGGGKVLYVIAADYNMEPETLARARLVDRIGGRIVAPTTPRGTCRTRTAARVYDYFYVATPMAELIRDVSTVEATNLRTHVPVAATFYPRMTALRALGIRPPPKLPTERTYGPLPPPPQSWASAREAADKACREARAGAAEARVMALLDAAYARWADSAEAELEDVTGTALPRSGCRSDPPAAAWRSILPERGDKNCGGDAARPVAAWAWLADILRDATRLTRPAQHDKTHDDAGRRNPHHLRQRARAEQVDLAMALMAAFDNEFSHFSHIEGFATAVQEASDIVRQAFMLCQYASRGQPPDGHAPKLSTVTTRLEDALGRARANHAAAAGAARSAGIEAWKKWLQAGFSAGARNAHLFSKLPTEWKPTVAASPQGSKTADPRKVLEAQREKYGKLWNAAEVPGGYTWPVREALPRLTPNELRDASRLFRRRTAETFDGFHCRQYSLLSDEALETLAVVLETCELIGRMPSRLNLVTTPLLEKPKGGYRPIAVYTSLYRLWAKARAPVARAWEEAHTRAYLSAARGNGPTDTTWRQAVRQESSVSGGGSAATILWDLESFFETVDRERLYRRAEAAGFPLAVLRLSLAAYSSPRLLALDGRLSRELWPTTGVGAGCGLACSYVKVYCMAPLDSILDKLPDTVTVDLHVDDFAITCEGANDHIVRRDIRVATDLIHDMIINQLGASISLPKAAMVASSRSLAVGIREDLGGLAGPLRATAANLGVDAAAARRRRTAGKNTLARSRIKQGLKRRRRLRKIASVVGAKALRIYVAGVGPSCVFHAAVHGLTDSEALTMRRIAAAACPPRSRLRSLTLASLWFGVPTATAEVAATLQYGRAVWQAVRAGSSRPRYPGFDLPGLRAAWDNIDQNITEYIDFAAEEAAQRRKWGATRGPIAAARLELDRIGWTAADAFHWKDDRGVAVCITATPPSLLRDLLRQSVRRRLERAAAAKWARDDETFRGQRVSMEAAQAALHKDANLTPLQKGAFRSTVLGGVMTMSKAHCLGYDVADVCPLCGEHGDSIHHRVYTCRATTPIVRAAVLGWFWAEAQRAPPGSRFWTTACTPHPADIIPQVRDDYLVRAEDEEGNMLEDPGLEGHIFIDGSCTASVHPGAQRAAFAAVQFDDNARSTKTVSVPLWSTLPQTPQAAEYAAMAAVVPLLRGPSKIYGDCQGVIDNMVKGLAGYLANKSKYGGVLLTTQKYQEGLNFIQEIIKVKAHQKLENITCPSERWLAEGNDRADKAAKAAVGRHDQPAVEQEAQLTFWAKRVPHVVRAVAIAMAEFPPTAGKLRKSTPQGSAAGRSRDHQPHHKWAFVEGRWRCTQCWSYVQGSADVPPSRTNQTCNRERITKELRAFAEKGHNMLFADAALPFAFCAKCGGWTSRRAYRLKMECSTPTTAGEQALARISRGQHPWRAKDHATGGERPRGVAVARAPGERPRVTAAGPRRGVLQSGSKRTAQQALQRPHGDSAASAKRLQVGRHSTGPDGVGMADTDATYTCMTDDYDVFGHGGALDEPEVRCRTDSDARGPAGGPHSHDGGAEGHTQQGHTDEARVADELRSIRGASMAMIVTVLRGLPDRLGPDHVLQIFNGATGRFVKVAVATVEAERDRLRAEGRRDDDRTCDGNSGEPERGDAHPGCAQAASAQREPPDQRGATPAAPPESNVTQRREDDSVTFHSRDALQRHLRGERTRPNGQSECVQRPTKWARTRGTWVNRQAGDGPAQRQPGRHAKRPRLNITGSHHLGGGPHSGDDERGSDTFGDKHAMAASAEESADAAREGPGNHSPRSDTAAATMPTVANVAAAVAKGELAADLDEGQLARDASAKRGKAARGSPCGAAAPQEGMQSTATGSLGREPSTTPMTKPQWTSGREPRTRQVQNPPHKLPQRLGAGPSTPGREPIVDDGGWPTRGEERRRDGSVSPAVATSAARSSDDAAVCHRREQPSKGCYRRRTCGARYYECDDRDVGSRPRRGGEGVHQDDEIRQPPTSTWQPPPPPKVLPQLEGDGQEIRAAHRHRGQGRGQPDGLPLPGERDPKRARLTGSIHGPQPIPSDSLEQRPRDQADASAQSTATSRAVSVHVWPHPARGGCPQPDGPAAAGARRAALITQLRGEDARNGGSLSAPTRAANVGPTPAVGAEGAQAIFAAAHRAGQPGKGQKKTVKFTSSSTSSANQPTAGAQRATASPWDEVDYLYSAGRPPEA